MFKNKKHKIKNISFKVYKNKPPTLETIKSIEKDSIMKTNVKTDFDLTSLKIAKKYGLKPHIVINLFLGIRDRVSEHVYISSPNRHYYSKNILPIVEKFLLYYKHNTFKDSLELIKKYLDEEKRISDLNVRPKIKSKIESKIESQDNFEIKNYVSLCTILDSLENKSVIPRMTLESFLYDYPFSQVKKLYSIYKHGVCIYHKDIIPLFQKFVSNLINDPKKDTEKAFEFLKTYNLSCNHNLEFCTLSHISKLTQVSEYKLRILLDKLPNIDNYRLEAYSIKRIKQQKRTTYVYDVKALPIIQNYLNNTNINTGNKIDSKIDSKIETKSENIVKSEVSNYISVDSLLKLISSYTNLTKETLNELIINSGLFERVIDVYSIYKYGYTLFHKDVIPIFKKNIMDWAKYKSDSDEPFKPSDMEYCVEHKLEVVNIQDISENLSIPEYQLRFLIRELPNIDNYRVKVSSIDTDTQQIKTEYLYDMKILSIIENFKLENNAINEIVLTTDIKDVISNEQEESKNNVQFLSEINHWKDVSKVKTETIEFLNSEIKVKNSELDTLRSELLSKNREIECLNTKVNILDSQVLNSNNRIKLLTKELNSIKSKPLVGFINKIF